MKYSFLCFLAISLCACQRGTFSERHIADFAAISSIITVLHLNTESIPTQKQGLFSLVKKPDDWDEDTPWIQYINDLPKDPWGNEYIYTVLQISSPPQYELRSLGPDRIRSSDDLTEIYTIESQK